MPTVLDVGNCNADHMFLEAMLSSNFGATLIRAHRLEDARELLGQNAVDLILVNRLLDVDGSQGLEVLRALKADPQTQAIPVMLITNYEEHQETAIEAGAIRGFGKSALNAEETRVVIEAAIGRL